MVKEQINFCFSRKIEIHDFCEGHWSQFLTIICETGFTIKETSFQNYAHCFGQWIMWKCILITVFCRTLNSFSFKTSVNSILLQKWIRTIMIKLSFKHISEFLDGGIWQIVFFLSFFYCFLKEFVPPWQSLIVKLFLASQ